MKLQPFLQSIDSFPLSIADSIHPPAFDFHRSLNTQTEKDHPVSYYRFILRNALDREIKVYLSIAFSDLNTLVIRQNAKLRILYSGDLLLLPERSVAQGQLCFNTFTMKPNGIDTCYLKLESLTPVSSQFKDITGKTLSIYTEQSFIDSFEKPRYLQAFFYGALVIMFFFNLFLFISTNSHSYLYYVIYLFILGIFFLSNSGYLFEFILPDFPRLDLAVRFYSTPLLLISYIIFSKYFLKIKLYLPTYDALLNAILCLLGGAILLMAGNQWRVGRSAVILLAICTFMLILLSAIKISLKGYKSAWYFLAGNILLIAGAVIYATERLLGISYNTFGQYSLQFAVLLEVAVFSMGLADRINSIQFELAQTKLEKEKEEKEHERTTRNIIEEKNKQLDAYIYRTAHDIRGPIASLMGMCQLALLEVKDAFALDYFGKLNAISNRLSYLLERLAAVHEITTLEYTPEVVHIPSLIEQVIQKLHKHGSANGICFSTDFNRIETLYTDKRLLYFILLNLIENATKFKTSEISIQPSVSVEVTKSANEFIIRIIDNGIGIPLQDADKIFNLFSTAATQYKTAGMGLYIVKTCMEKCGGLVTFQTVESKTVFSLSFPGKALIP